MGKNSTPNGLFKKNRENENGRTSETDQNVSHNKKLSLKAKGLYFLIKACLENGEEVNKEYLKSLCTEGTDSFQSIWNELKDSGILKQTRKSTPKGFVYEYELAILPMEKNKKTNIIPIDCGKPSRHDDSPCSENQYMGEPYAESPCTENPYIGNLCMGNQYVETPYAENPCMGEPCIESPSKNLSCSTVSSNNNNNNNFQKIDRWMDGRKALKNPSIHLSFENTKTMIKHNIDYDTVFASSFDKELVDNIVDIMAEVFVDNSQTIKIKDKDMPSEIVKSQFMKINAIHIQHVIDVISGSKKIKNIKGYTISVLYNATLTMGLFYNNKVSSEQA